MAPDNSKTTIDLVKRLEEISADNFPDKQGIVAICHEAARALKAKRDEDRKTIDTLGELLVASAAEANQKGAGGYLLARISDAFDIVREDCIERGVVIPSLGEKPCQQ